MNDSKEHKKVVGERHQHKIIPSRDPPAHLIYSYCRSSGSLRDVTAACARYAVRPVPQPPPRTRITIPFFRVKALWSSAPLEGSSLLQGLWGRTQGICSLPPPSSPQPSSLTTTLNWVSALETPLWASALLPTTLPTSPR